jgi:5-methylcytosine-specific restriction endonuclease McrA
MPESRVTAQQKKAVAERAKGCCEYCRSQASFAIQPFAVEHIIPKSQGGETKLDNLALACQGCNNHKYNKIEGRVL